MNAPQTFRLEPSNASRRNDLVHFAHSSRRSHYGKAASSPDGVAMLLVSVLSGLVVLVVAILLMQHLNELLERVFEAFPI